MKLSDRDIKERIKKGNIIIQPKPDFKKQLGPASLDLRLGKHIRISRHIFKEVLDPKKKESVKSSTKEIEVRKYFVIQPGQDILASTKEIVGIPSDLCAKMEGRSSLGRLHINIHSTAGFIDPGFKGQITLELKNDGSVGLKLYPGMRICQIVFDVLSSEAENPYDGKYKGDKGPAESRIYKDYS